MRTFFVKVLMLLMFGASGVLAEDNAGDQPRHPAPTPSSLGARP